MKRDIYVQLQAWKANPRRKPLIMRGARQVGKTTLLKEFGKQSFARVIYLNFEEDPGLNELFAGRLDPKVILEHISIYLNQKIEPTDTLLIFDEIQIAPNALNSLKYFQEKAPDYFIAAAGSLLGVTLANNKGFPVGKVQFIDLYPLSFFEFLNALGRDEMRRMLERIAVTGKIPEPIHQELIVLLKQYYFVGGMPEAVVEFIASQDFQKTRKIQQDILAAYQLDFAKYANPNDIMKINNIWQAIPGQLAKENQKFIFSSIAGSARAREYDVALQWLLNAGLIYKAHHIRVPKLPLASYGEMQGFKIFLLDVGLLCAMTKLAPSIILMGSELFTEFKGSLTENFVAQTLMLQEPHSLYYWTSSGKAEVDFVVPYNNAVYPLEAKAGNTTKHKSLNIYHENHTPPALTRTNLLNLDHVNYFYNIPLYMIGRFPSLIADNES